jgi:hypothetical protein
VGNHSPGLGAGRAGTEREGDCAGAPGHHGLAGDGAQLQRPYYLALLAEGYGKVWQAEEGLSVLAEGLTAVHNIGELQHEAELYRLTEELRLKQAVPAEQEAESCLRQAVDVARQQQRSH